MVSRQSQLGVVRMTVRIGSMALLAMMEYQELDLFFHLKLLKTEVVLWSLLSIEMFF